MLHSGLLSDDVPMEAVRLYLILFSLSCKSTRPTSLTCQMFLVFSFSSLFMSKAKAVLYVFDFIQILQSEHSFV